MIVVNAKPLNRPAPAQYSGIIAATRVRYAERIIEEALLILSLIPAERLLLASSRIMICWSTPVPIVAKIPAIEGRSRFQPIKEATPRMMINSEKEVKSRARDALIFLYLTRTIKDTKTMAEIIATNIAFMNPFPKDGEIVSSFTISNL